MKFEVTKDYKTMFSTPDISCIPDKDTLSQMQKAGYKFKLNGKQASIKAITEFIKKEG